MKLIDLMKNLGTGSEQYSQSCRRNRPSRIGIRGGCVMRILEEF